MRWAELARTSDPQLVEISPDVRARSHLFGYSRKWALSGLCRSLRPCLNGHSLRTLRTRRSDAERRHTSSPATRRTPRISALSVRSASAASRSTCSSPQRRYSGSGAQASQCRARAASPPAPSPGGAGVKARAEDMAAQRGVLFLRRERAAELLFPPVGLNRAEAFLRRPEDGSGPDQLALALGDRPVSVLQFALLLL